MKCCVVDMRRMLSEGLNQFTKSHKYLIFLLYLSPLFFNLLFKLGPGRVWRKLYIKALKLGALQKGGDKEEIMGKMLEYVRGFERDV